MRRAGRILLYGTAALVVLIAGSQLFARHSISRQSLGIVDGDAQQRGCAWRIPIQTKKEFVPETGSYNYLQYAVAAADVYDRQPSQSANGGTLENYGGDWKNVTKKKFDNRNLSSGLVADYYFKDDSKGLVVLIVFRGTVTMRDWLSNASWFARWLPLTDHYSDARHVFEQIRTEALAEAKGKSVSFVVTGHSLGGGLAMHIAYGYPCVSGVVFNASPVTNKYLYKQPFEDATIALLHQHCEVLGWARQFTGGQDSSGVAASVQSLFGGPYVSSNYHFYDYDLYFSKEDNRRSCFDRLFSDKRPYHNMDYYVAGLSRFAITCEQEVANKAHENYCGFLAFPQARRVYCTFYGSKKGFGEDEPCQCKHWPADKRAKDLCY